MSDIKKINSILDFNKLKVFAEEQRKLIEKYKPEILMELKHYYDIGKYQIVCRGLDKRFSCDASYKKEHITLGVCLTLEDGNEIRFGIDCPYMNEEFCLLKEKLQNKKEVL